ncbi:HlyD family secretion protein [Actinoplanes sp. N902-109]|uniref:HlyD family secretion protein n=1 Tax=Actinoplanes sp. (strain N902-109) TaxID=649831 RepID=UPI0003293F48|nr:HlyD family secretion protein [Actinoplanes sp. N902-109]AGL18400.1 hypothetical protein L083_4890 [Actinoplanes sp. N902-109]
MTSVMEHDHTELAGPAPQPAPPAPGRHSKLPAVRTFLVTTLLLGGAAAGGYAVVGHRLTEETFVTLEDATLTADALQLGATGSGVVTDVLVTGQTRVAAGQQIGHVKLAEGGAVQTLRAPAPGTVAEVDVPAGGVVGAAEPVITLYDHSKLSFHAKATEDELRELRLGMSAQITGPGLARPVPAVVDHVAARVGPDPLADAPLTEEQQAAHEQLTVVLVPRTDAVDTVSALVPGLRFTAAIDTKTARGRTPAVNGAG